MQTRIIRSFKNILRKCLASRVDRYISRNSLACIILVYNAAILLAIAALYKLIPVLMCYADKIREGSNSVNFSYDIQFIAGTVVALIASSVTLRFLFKGIDEYKMLSTGREEDIEKLRRIRKKCMNLPYIIYLYQIFLPTFIAVLIGIIGHMLVAAPFVLIGKLLCLVFCFCFLSSVVAYTFSRYIFTKILYDTYIDDEPEGARVNIGTKMLVQVIPMVITAVIITAMLGYSRLIDEKGDILQDTYKYKLEESLNNAGKINDWTSLSEILKNVRLDGIETTYFAALAGGRVITSDESKLTPYFIYFINNPEDGYRVYGYTKETQGVIKKIDVSGETWTVGVYFEVESKETVEAFAVALIILVIVNILVIYYFSKSISSDITHVADNLMAIGQGGSIKERKDIPIISNDEIGDLINAFNRIQQLETKNDNMKNEFFANVSHELRTPLNIILSSVQLMSSLRESDAQRDSKVDIEKISEMIKQNSYRLLRLVNNLIDSSKIGAAFYDVHMKNCNIVNVVEEISLYVANYIKERNIEFLFDTEIEERIMACDVDMVERIMLNLLSNAVKFTPPGGNIFVSMREKNNNVIISVRDSGIGISSEEQKVIFERFKQVDKSFARRREGSGIGLFLVKLLVELHKGSVSVMSEPGKGSEFVVILPESILSDQEDTDYQDKLIYNGKEQNNIEKIKIEFSDIY
ncbi:MAG: HAMP domain-containing sensor histidine kinase [Bacillota bacterium]|nr:HAMP domain-containing sensor histidine kinase [Bacillota bacterium]